MEEMLPAADADAVPPAAVRGPSGPLRPIVAIVGRPNVGKSTLFNRITGTRRAITDDRPGVTRDRIHAVARWGEHTFTLIDTGGYVSGSKDEIEGGVRRQAETAIDEADIVLFVCDVSDGVTSLDRDVADLLRRRDMPCLLVLNKVDHPDAHRYDLSEFYAFGLGEPYPVSAASGRRSGDLLDLLVMRFEDLATSAPEAETDMVRMVLVGRPNVGKSTLINRLAGREISIVHDVPGTTRDATDVTLERDGRRFTLVDTAGMRRRAKVTDPVEYYSGLRATYSIERADIAVVLIDAIEGATAQDARIIGRAMELGKGLIVAVNKWDLMKGREDAVGIDEFRDNLRHQYPFLVPYPILVLSALTGSRADRCLDEAARVWDRSRQKIPTSQLNRWVVAVTERVPPTAAGREIRILYVTQSAVAPPTFLVFATRPDLITESYRRHMERCLRQEFDLEGTPVRIHWRHSRSRRGRGGEASSR